MVHSETSQWLRVQIHPFPKALLHHAIVKLKIMMETARVGIGSRGCCRDNWSRFMFSAMTGWPTSHPVVSISFCYCLPQKALGTGRWTKTVSVCHQSAYSVVTAVFGSFHFCFREGETETDRQTHRHTDTQTDRQTDRDREKGNTLLHNDKKIKHQSAFLQICPWWQTQQNSIRQTIQTIAAN